MTPIGWTKCPLSLVSCWSTTARSSCSQRVGKAKSRAQSMAEPTTTYPLKVIFASLLRIVLRRAFTQLPIDMLIGCHASNKTRRRCFTSCCSEDRNRARPIASIRPQDAKNQASPSLALILVATAHSPCMDFWQRCALPAKFVAGARWRSNFLR